MPPKALIKIAQGIASLLFLLGPVEASLAQPGNAPPVQVNDAGIPILAQPREHGANFVLTELALQSTYKITGPGKNGRPVVATAVLAGKPCPRRPNTTLAVMVTASHVLESIAGNTLTVSLREKRPDGWTATSWPITIKIAGKPLWKKHPNVDLAVSYFPLPRDFQGSFIPLNAFATDTHIQKLELMPGDNVFSLGYPLNISSSITGDFPILRSGRIASYPLHPTSKVRSFYIDTRVFPGNSGGPVYLLQSAREIRGIIEGSTTRFAVLGIMTDHLSRTGESEDASAAALNAASLELGNVVHASFVVELIESLPLIDGC